MAALCPATALWDDGISHPPMSHFSHLSTFHFQRESHQSRREKGQVEWEQGGPGFALRDSSFSSRMFKDQDEKLKSKKQNQ